MGVGELKNPLARVSPKEYLTTSHSKPFDSLPLFFITQQPFPHSL